MQSPKKNMTKAYFNLLTLRKNTKRWYWWSRPVLIVILDKISPLLAFPGTQWLLLWRVSCLRLRFSLVFTSVFILRRTHSCDQSCCKRTFPPWFVCIVLGPIVFSNSRIFVEKLILRIQLGFSFVNFIVKVPFVGHRPSISLEILKCSGVRQKSLLGRTFRDWRKCPLEFLEMSVNIFLLPIGLNDFSVVHIFHRYFSSMLTLELIIIFCSWPCVGVRKLFSLLFYQSINIRTIVVLMLGFVRVS
jgi:hypothetical protein